MANGLKARLDATGPALAGLAARVRALIDATVSAEAPPAALAAATAAVEQALAALAPHVPAARAPRYPETADLADPGALMPFDPLMGPMSPLAPPIAFTADASGAVGRVRFGTAYEGPPGCVHGGVLAAAFDQALNVANLFAGVPGPTKRLTLRFHKPTPLGADVEFETRVASSDDRRVVTRGSLRHGGTVTVEAEGEFARLSLDRVMRLLGR